MVDILYEDNHIIVVYKPKGVLSQADGSNCEDMLTIIKKYIKDRYNKPGNVYLGLVHRLDKNTDGIMVFARTSKAASRLSEDIKKHNFKKKYIAVVEGKLEKTGVLKSRLAKDDVAKKAYPCPSGSEAVLEYKVIKEERRGNTLVSIVDVDLHTGRFHQIRAQFSEIGHPLYGDNKYGSKNKISFMEFPLTAYSLGFFHPTTKEWLVFEK